MATETQRHGGREKGLFNNPHSLFLRVSVSPWRTCCLRLCVGLLVAVIVAAPAVSAQAKRPTTSRKATSNQASSTPSNDKFDQLARKADEAREANRLEEATALYLQALRIKPKWKE